MWLLGVRCLGVSATRRLRRVTAAAAAAAAAAKVRQARARETYTA